MGRLVREKERERWTMGGRRGAVRTLQPAVTFPVQCSDGARPRPTCHGACAQGPATPPVGQSRRSVCSTVAQLVHSSSPQRLSGLTPSPPVISRSPSYTRAPLNQPLPHFPDHSITPSSFPIFFSSFTSPPPPPLLAEGVDPGARPQTHTDCIRICTARHHQEEELPSRTPDQ